MIGRVKPRRRTFWRYGPLRRHRTDNDTNGTRRIKIINSFKGRIRAPTGRALVAYIYIYNFYVHTQEVHLNTYI